MEEVPFFSREAMERVSKAVRDIEDMKSGFPLLVKELLPDYFGDSVTINVVEVLDDIPEAPGHWLGIVHCLDNPTAGTKEPAWKVLKKDGDTDYWELMNDEEVYYIYVIPPPGPVDEDGYPTPGVLTAGMYVGVLWGVTEPTGLDDEEPDNTEVFLAVGGIGTTSSGGGVVVRAAATGPGPLNGYIQIVNPGTGNLQDIGSPITLYKFQSPAREDFETDGRYPAFLVELEGTGTYRYFAETGPKSKCEEVVTKDSIGHLNCSTLQITFTNTKKVRVIDRACP